MTNGMLWFDNRDDCTLATKLERAVEHYVNRYHTQPTLCIVHPVMLIDGADLIMDIEVRASNDVLPNHFWLGHRSERVAA